MGFFSKPAGAKPAPAPAKPAGSAGPAADARPAPLSARELAAKATRRPEPAPREPSRADESITGASLVEWSQPQAIEVAQANPGLCAVLENAALLYASGQAANARALLEQGVASDHDTRQSALAWLALFDLLQRAGDRAAFDQLALQYSVQFERSAPGWEAHHGAGVESARPAGGGYIAIAGKLTAQSDGQLEGLRRAVAKKLPQARLDLGGVAGFDDAGAAVLAAALAAARRARLLLTIERADKLRAGLEAAVKAGRDGGEGAWQLSLELLQWLHDNATFDERAIEYAIAFEMSPPSWEPPAKPKESAPAASGTSSTADEPAASEAVTFAGTITGSAAGQFSKLSDFAHGKHVVPVDMSRVDRIDFVSAGALLNLVNRVEGQRKSVQIHGATPIIRALLLLIGLAPRHFVRKPA